MLREMRHDTSQSRAHLKAFFHTDDLGHAFSLSPGYSVGHLYGFEMKISGSIYQSLGVIKCF